MNCAKINLDKRKLYKWIVDLKTPRPPEQDVPKKSGTKALNEFEIQVLIGWVLTENRKKYPVKYQMVMEKAQEFFAVKLEYETCRNYMDAGGISMKKLVSKGPDLAVTTEEVFESLKLSCQELRTSGYLDGKVRKQDIYCLDFIHDSHWAQINTGLGAKGAQTKGQTKRNGTTSAFLVGNSLAGRVLPPIMFTLDKRFERKRGKLHHFEEKHRRLMVSYGIQEWQFVCCDEISETKKDQTVAGEKKEYTLEALRLWRKYDLGFGAIGNLVFLTDCGGSFLLQGQSLLEFKGCLAHLKFIPISHMLQSTLDNGVNLFTKNEWRRLAHGLPGNHSCQPEDAFNMLKSAMDHSTEFITKCWTKNLLLDIDDIDKFSLQDFKERFNFTTGNWIEYHQQCEGQVNDYWGKKGEWAFLRKVGTAGVVDTGLNGSFYDDTTPLRKGQFI